MADAIAESTMTMGLAHAKAFENHSRMVLIGGGARSSAFTARELRGVTCPNGLSIAWDHAEYRLVDYVPLHRVDPESSRHRECLVAELPVSSVCKKLDARELRQLATLHGISVSTRTVRATLLHLLGTHKCTAACEKAYAVLAPLSLASSGIDSGIDVEAADFVSSFRAIPTEDLIPYVSGFNAPLDPRGYTVVGVHRVQTGFTLGTGDITVTNLPLTLLGKYTTVDSIKRLAGVHGMAVPKRWTKPQIMCALRDHRCDSCQDLFFVLRPKVVGRPERKERLKDKGAWLDKSDVPFLWQTFMEIPTEQYPPRPTTMRDVATAMAKYCDDMSPDAVVQAGCAVCGQLRLRKTMRPFNLESYEAGILEEIGCTRRERLAASSYVEGIEGAVVDKSLSDICVDCHEDLVKAKRPKEALANHLWLGDVPECLKDLTLGECALISRVRYNQCVVRVSQGHAKMIANVVAFEHPSKKIYERLPMPADELSEVLSIVYTGIEPPSDSDLNRTPVLVRRGKVQLALEWLKLNHKDYADLEIDYKTLEAYPLESVPIGLLRKDLSGEHGNILAAAKSVFNNDLEEGTASGMCPYAVSGLTAEQHGSLTTTQRKAIGLLNLKNGGSSLAVGHDSVPQSMWNNPGLYPQMYPWLFPYGLGGVGQDCHIANFGRQAHIKWLLGYHDKRFQRDAGFLIVAMNHQLIRQSSKGSFIAMKRGNFGRAAEAIDKLDPGVLLSIVEKTKDGGRFFPQTPEERKCATLMDQVDVVGSYVDGSLARKKFQRGELWSLINFCNAPHWFITISPADSKHPLCVHWASNDTEFYPEIKGYKERQHLVTRNPVACALFFDHVVQLFIKHICGWSTENGEVRRGLFGVPGAYYGTVEEQGRKTLHLHFLLWIKGQLPLHVVRERLMSEDSDFQRELSEYIESCMKGEFFTGSKDEVAANIPITTEVEDRGIHTIMVESTVSDASYKDPTLTLPEAPPRGFCKDVETCQCSQCMELDSWWERFKVTCDDILLRSNVHTCFGRKDKADRKADKMSDGSDAPASTTKGAKIHATGKGCLNKKGICTARFPREVFMHSSVDPKTGHLNVKKRESCINDVCPAITVTHRCNTDCRCLLSGTSVKAVVGYVTDYISKAWLKTHQIFQTAYDAFSKNESILTDSRINRDTANDANAARRMIIKVVNSLSSKMEIGGPMAALYLLEKPDHYTSHTFVPFYWKNYFNFVQSRWTALEDAVQEEDVEDDATPADVGVIRMHYGASNHIIATDELVATELGHRLAEEGHDHVEVKIEDLENDLIVLQTVDGDGERGNESGDRPDDSNITEDLHEFGGQDNSIGQGGASDETITISRSRGSYHAKSNTDDYRHRPRQFNEVYGRREFHG